MWRPRPTPTTVAASNAAITAMVLTIPTPRSFDKKSAVFIRGPFDDQGMRRRTHAHGAWRATRQVAENEVRSDSARSMRGRVKRTLCRSFGDALLVRSQLCVTRSLRTRRQNKKCYDTRAAKCSSSFNLDAEYAAIDRAAFSVAVAWVTSRVACEVGD